MKRDKVVILNIEEDLKTKSVAKAESLGLTLSSFIRMLLASEVNK